MEHHRERRRPTRSEAWLTAGQHSAMISLRNVSRRGLAVGNAPTLPAGTLCRIEKGPLTVFAIVRWQSKGEMGLELAQPLNDQDAALFGIKSRH